MLAIDLLGGAAAEKDAADLADGRLASLNGEENVSASEGPMPRPMISRRPSVLAATAIMAATGTIRPPWRTFR